MFYTLCFVGLIIMRFTVKKERPFKVLVYIFCVMLRNITFSVNWLFCLAMVADYIAKFCSSVPPCAGLNTHMWYAFWSSLATFKSTLDWSESVFAWAHAALPNQYCSIIFWENWGWFLICTILQATPTPSWSLLWTTSAVIFCCCFCGFATVARVVGLTGSLIGE